MCNLKKIGQFLATVGLFIGLGACVAPPMQSATPTPTPTTTAMAMAPVATDVVHTTQAPASVVIEAKKVTTNGKNAIEVSWSDTLSVSMVARYVGSGKGGSMSVIPVDGTTKKVFFVDGMKDGFNFKFASGNYLHLECGGNDKTTQPTLRGLAVDCQRLDAVGRNLGGALVVKL